MAETYLPQNGLATLYAEDVVLLGPVESMSAGSATSKAYVDSVVQSTITEEKKDREIVDEQHRVRLADAEVLINTNESAQQQQNQLLSGLISNVSMGIETEQGARAFADTEIKTSVESEVIRAVAQENFLNEEIQGLASNKLSKEGGTMNGDLHLDTYLYFSSNWRVSGSENGSKLTFEHFKSDSQTWKIALPFICSI
jgi:hypothetical protein